MKDLHIYPATSHSNDILKDEMFSIGMSFGRIRAWKQLKERREFHPFTSQMM